MCHMHYYVLSIFYFFISTAILSVTNDDELATVNAFKIR